MYPTSYFCSVGGQLKKYCDSDNVFSVGTLTGNRSCLCRSQAAVAEGDLNLLEEPTALCKAML